MKEVNTVRGFGGRKTHLILCFSEAGTVFIRANTDFENLT